MKNDIGNINAGSVGTMDLPYFSFTFILRVVVRDSGCETSIWVSASILGHNLGFV